MENQKPSLNRNANRPPLRPHQDSHVAAKWRKRMKLPTLPLQQPTAAMRLKGHGASASDKVKGRLKVMGMILNIELYSWLFIFMLFVCCVLNCLAQNRFKTQVIFGSLRFFHVFPEKYRSHGLRRPPAPPPPPRGIKSPNVSLGDSHWPAKRYAWPVHHSGAIVKTRRIPCSQSRCSQASKTSPSQRPKVERTCNLEKAPQDQGAPAGLLGVPGKGHRKGPELTKGI